MASKETLARAGLWLAVTATGALASACASAPPPPELDLSRLRIVATDRATRIDVNGLPGGKVVGAGVGAGTGSGAGVLLAGAMCVATGPFFPLCALALVPTGAAVGAVTGGVVGAVRTESVDAIDLKGKVLREHFEAVSYSSLLAGRLQAGIAEGRAIAGVAAAPSADGETAGDGWTLDVAVTEVGTEGKSEFALRLVTRISLRRDKQAAPIWSIARQVQSETELTTAAWMAADARAMQTVLDRCVDQAARALLLALARPSGRDPAAPRLSRPTASCDDVPADVKAAGASFAASSRTPSFVSGPVSEPSTKEAP